MTFYDLDGPNDGTETVRLEGIDSYILPERVNTDVTSGDGWVQASNNFSKTGKSDVPNPDNIALSEEQLSEMLWFAKKNWIQCVVEVHDKFELEIALQFSHKSFLHNLSIPFKQLSDLATILAIVVFPTPLMPVKRYALGTLFDFIELKIV